MLKNFVPRLYQETILGTSSLKNCLVVLPTGLGKTGVALLLSIQRLKNHPNSKIVFLAPTKPLVEQHKATFEKHLDFSDALIVLTGETAPAKRSFLWNDNRIIFSTPQGLENDLINKNISLKDVSLIIFDEAHRSVGNYSYVFIAKEYMKKADFPRILALTASPGSDVESIEDVCRNLFIEAVEIKTESDFDVSPYVQETDIGLVKVDLSPELKKVKENLDKCLNLRFLSLRRLGISQLRSKKDILAQQFKLRSLISKGEKSGDIFNALSVLAEVIKIQHAQELVETQTVAASFAYFNKLFNDSIALKTKAVKNLVEDPFFKASFYLISELFNKNLENPKVDKLKDLVDKIFSCNKEGKVIVFTQFRDSALRVKEVLDLVEGCRCAVFFGQAKKNGAGLSQKEQKKAIDLFRDGETNCLIATSVAEEGLDIPSVDNVVFYEPIPSSIRTIQRRGRTGRNDKGNVLVLVVKGSRDEAYRNVAKFKEKKMNLVLNDLKKHFSLKSYEVQKEVLNCDKKILVIADYREKSSPVIKNLISSGVNLKLEMLDSADFILSHSCGVEFKTVPDFVNSIVDGRILEQVRNLKQRFEKPLLLIEGSEDLYSVRNVHPNAVRGMLAAISVGFGVPILRSKDSEDSAGILESIASREQKKDSDFNIHFSKPKSEKEMQEFVVSSLPSIGDKIAVELLKEFGSVKNVFNSDITSLKSVKGVGEKIAESLIDFFQKEYKKE
jgi:ERCC4-related helicase